MEKQNIVPEKYIITKSDFNVRYIFDQELSDYFTTTDRRWRVGIWYVDTEGNHKTRKLGFFATESEANEFVDNFIKNRCIFTIAMQQETAEHFICRIIRGIQNRI